MKKTAYRDSEAFMSELVKTQLSQSMFNSPMKNSKENITPQTRFNKPK